MAAEKSRNKSKNEGNALTRPFSGIIAYLREVRDELNKVTWPTRPEVIRLFRVVVIVTIAFAIVLGGLSVFLSFFIQQGLEQPLLLLVAFVLIVGGIIYWMRRESSGKAY